MDGIINGYLCEEKSSFCINCLSKISKGNIKEVIEEITIYAKERNYDNLYTNAIQISSRYFMVNDSVQKGTIRNEESSLEFNKINLALITLLSDFQKQLNDNL